MRVEEDSGADGHVADLLALYHLDALDERAEERVGRHLESCAQCRAAAADVCETIAALALLTDHSDDLLNQYGALGAAGAHAFPERFAPQEPADRPERLIHRIAEAAESSRFRLRRRGRATGKPTTTAGPPAATTSGRPPVAETPSAPVPEGDASVPKPERLPPPPQLTDALPPVVPPPVAPAAQAREAEEPPPALHPEPPAAQPPVALRPEPPAAQLPVARRPAAAPAAPKTGPRRDPGGTGRAGERRRFAIRRSAALVRLTCLLMLAVALAGFSVYALVGPELKQSTAADLTAAASATDRETGANLSVHVTEEQSRVSVRAMVSGLEAGVGYRLYGSPFDGRPQPVVNWTGRAGAQEVTGELPLTIADLSHFTVMRGARTIVTVYLPRTSAGG